jgi:metal-dependent amidase/aminoacylase/carboxypeptidase family protein
LGKIEGIGATNVIPPVVKMEGTFRTFDEEWREKAHQKIKQIATSIAAGFDAKAVVTISKGYPFLKNDVDLTQSCQKAASDYLGSSHVEELGIWMAGEDFSYYSQEVPSVFYRFGVRNEALGITENVHHPAFDIDTDSLKTATGMMAWLACYHGHKI